MLHHDFRDSGPRGVACLGFPWLGFTFISILVVGPSLFPKVSSLPEETRLSSLVQTAEALVKPFFLFGQAQSPPLCCIRKCGVRRSPWWPAEPFTPGWAVANSIPGCFGGSSHGWSGSMLLLPRCQRGWGRKSGNRWCLSSIRSVHGLGRNAS